MFQSVLRHLRDSQAAELEGGGAAESGFTLIELMVVLLIIAILLAIAIPTFLGVTGSANDRAAQSNLTNALTEAAAVYQGNSQSFQGIQTTLSSSAPEFTWVSSAVAPTAGSNQVGIVTVDVATGTVGTTTSDYQGVVLADLSKNNHTCWWSVQLDATPAVITGDANPAFESAASGSTGGQTGATTAGTYYAKSTTSGACKANYPLTRTGGFSWGTNYSNAPVNT
jgi:type IV pilus assembly protein PilA